MGQSLCFCGGGFFPFLVQIMNVRRVRITHVTYMCRPKTELQVSWLYMYPCEFKVFIMLRQSGIWVMQKIYKLSDLLRIQISLFSWMQLKFNFNWNWVSPETKFLTFMLRGKEKWAFSVKSWFGNVLPSYICNVLLADPQREIREKTCSDQLLCCSLLVKLLQPL